MAAIHETAYPRIKPNMSHHELKEIFTPSEEELALLNRKTKRTLPVSRLGFMVILKCYQYLGRMIKVQKIDSYIKKYIAERIGIDPLVDLNGYSKLTRNRHIKIIREHLNISTNKNERRKLMKSAALVAAKTKENLADIINVIIDELIKFQFELPAFKKLVRVARAARTVTNNNNYIEIYNKLSEEQKKIIDIMLGIIKEEDDKNHDHLSWFLLK